MKIVEVRNIKRRDIPIYYRKMFTGQAVIEVLDRQSTANVEFVIEHQPSGAPTITIRFLGDIDYPLVPAQRSLKLYIADLEAKGLLP